MVGSSASRLIGWGTDGSVHTAQESGGVGSTIHARLGQSRQSPGEAGTPVENIVAMLDAVKEFNGR